MKWAKPEEKRTQREGTGIWPDWGGDGVGDQERLVPWRMSSCVCLHSRSSLATRLDNVLCSPRPSLCFNLRLRRAGGGGGGAAGLASPLDDLSTGSRIYICCFSRRQLIHKNARKVKRCKLKVAPPVVFPSPPPARRTTPPHHQTPWSTTPPFILTHLALAFCAPAFMQLSA